MKGKKRFRLQLQLHPWMKQVQISESLKDWSVYYEFIFICDYLLLLSIDPYLFIFLSSFYVVLLLPFLEVFIQNPSSTEITKIQFPGKIEHYASKFSGSYIPAIVPRQIHFPVNIFGLC